MLSNRLLHQAVHKTNTIPSQKARTDHVWFHRKSRSAEIGQEILVILWHDDMAESVTLEIKDPFFIRAPELAGGLELALRESSWLVTWLILPTSDNTR